MFNRINCNKLYSMLANTLPLEGPLLQVATVENVY